MGDRNRESGTTGGEEWGKERNSVAGNERKSGYVGEEKGEEIKEGLKGRRGEKEER